VVRKFKGSFGLRPQDDGSFPYRGNRWGSKTVILRLPQVAEESPEPFAPLRVIGGWDPSGCALRMTGKGVILRLPLATEESQEIHEDSQTLSFPWRMW